jgi:hypothetical protein
MSQNEKNLRDVPLCIPLRSRMLIPYLFSEMDIFIFASRNPIRKNLFIAFPFQNAHSFFVFLFQITPWTLISLAFLDLRTSPFQIL